MKKVVWFCCLMLVTSISDASEKITIAGIFEENIPYKKSATQEILCMTQAVFEEARISGMNLKYVNFDNKRSAKATFDVAKKIAKTGFDLVLGTGNSSEAIPASRVFNDAKIPFFVPNATNPKVTDSNPYSVAIVAGDRIQAQVLAKYSKQRFNPKRIAIIVNVSRTYSEFLAKEFAQNIQKISQDVRIETLEIYDGYEKYTQLVDRLEALKLDLVMLPLINPRVARIYMEIAKQGLTLNLLGGDGVGGRESFFRMIGRTSPNITFYFLKHFKKSFEGPEKHEYLRLFQKYCSNKHDHTFFTVLGYDTATFVTRTIATDPVARGLNLVKRAKELNYHGLLGKMKFDSNGDTVKPFHIFKLENNSMTFQETFTL